MLQTLTNILSVFFSLYMFGYATFILIGNFFALWRLRKSYRRTNLQNYIEGQVSVPVSVLVPAYNEAETILSTIHNLLIADFKRYEIVVIDDGSTDETAKLILEKYPLTRNTIPFQNVVKSAPINQVYTGTVNGRLLTLIRKDNGGNKADALNAGINVAKYPYFVAMDGDEILQADALKNAARSFLEDEKVIAVGGIIRVSNGIRFKEGYPVETRMSKNPVIASQRLDYNRSFMASRVFSDMFNGNLNISGGFGMFKKEPVIKIGGYDSNSVGEDMDLVMRLHDYHLENDIPYKMSYTPTAVCWTQVPFTMKDLGNQRARWHRGLIQSMVAHRKFFLNPRYGSVSLISFMYYFFYEFLSPMIELFGFLFILFALIMGTLNWPFAIFIASLYIVFNVINTIIFYTGNFLIGDFQMYRGDTLRVLWISLIDIFVIRPFLFIVRIFATLTYRSRLHNWGELTREAMEDVS